MRLIREFIDESWRLLRLFAVGCAWAVPFLLVSYVNANPGVAAHPRLAAAFEAVQWPMLLIAPLASLLGIVLVAWMTRGERGGSLATALVALLLPAVGGVAIAARNSADIDWVFYALPIMAGGIVVLGLAFTIAVLARKAWWLGIMWSVLWSAAASIVWLSGARTVDGGDDLGSGLLIVLAGTAVLSVSAFGALVGFIGPRIAVNARRQADLAATFEGTI